MTKSSRFAERNGDNRKDDKAMKEKKAAAAPPNKLEKKPSVDINESAEAFIQKFRHQLLLQRLESIENYEQMLARGL
ncbi:putative lactoylglutathione lyase [Hibiscus syriacus]|uniref:Lactoylglutathione lyase n=1 Tax=Hibiscus syriacus TaxID=106335 RepID=A0A6A2Y1G1_HIBSY|nr:putative lactoylglutathione lyase [Hibiscus syriacus]